MSTFKIFYSWQSDLPGNKTRNFIRDCIDDAIAFAGESEAIEAVRDEATKDTTGSPNIVTTLFSKINDCDLFVADVSLCFTGDVKKKQGGKDLIKHSPNPNVLLELGYAVKTLDWDHVICLYNTDFGSDYPFDIAQNRRTPYSLDGRDKASVRREVAKIIFDNIKTLKGQPPRAKAGVASHIIGTYDFVQQKVTGALVALEIGKCESYQLHNDELLAESKEIVTEIQSITDKMMAKAEREKLKVAVTDIPHPSTLGLDNLQMKQNAIHAIAESYKASETPVVWKDNAQDRERIKKWLGIDVGDDFFDLGGLKQIVQLLNLNGATLGGTDEEKEKYDKLQELSYKLLLLDVRIKYLNTFEGMCFIPLAIQNISRTQDSNIHIVVNVEAGEIVDPNEHLILEEFEGLQGMLCKDDENEKDAGIIAELFLLSEDGVIHTEEETWYPTAPKAPILTRYGFQMPEKTKEDYQSELKEFIASGDGRGYYEFDVKKLRPGECRWLSTGMLIKPFDGKVKVNYRIHSDHSSGELSGELEWLSSKT
ncbi:MAG: hypothetical protein IJI25_05000 [Eubacterium sp.]|nr:hypothetical protein [Eubacterium sp.]